MPRNRQVPSVDDHKDDQIRGKTEGFFGYVEDVFYVAVAVSLALAGVMLFGYVIYDFATKLLDGGDLTGLILEFLDGFLLVFIITELIHTIRAVIDEKVLVAEPFLIVGIVAAIRRLIVISAEAKEMVGTQEFVDAMTEVGLLTGAVLLLAGAIFLLRARRGVNRARRTSRIQTVSGVWEASPGSRVPGLARGPAFALELERTPPHSHSVR